jgi:hypothetical protein
VLVLFALVVRAAAGTHARAVGPVLIVDNSGDGGGDAADAARPEGAVALAVETLAPVEAERLRGALDELATRLGARAHPLGADLEDGPPEQALDEALRALRPKLTAAESLTAGHWRSADGRLRVTAAAECPPQRRARCFPVADAPADGLERWARFFAWPVAAGGVLGFGSRADARAAVDRLRARAASADSRIALVVGAGDRDAAPARAIAVEARRVLALLPRGEPKSEARALLEELAHDAPAPPLPWVALAPDEVLVVPRLGALIDAAGFTREIESALPAPPAWRRRPTALD